MSIQISVDPTALSQEQREAVAGFILAFPTKTCAGTCGHAVAEIQAHTHQAAAASGDTGPALDPEIAALVKDDGEFQASVAFGGPQPDAMAAAVFGSAPSPLPLGATAAPSIAVANPSLTAPAAIPGTTSTATSTAPVPPAPMPANAAPIAAPPTANHAGGVELDKHGLPWDGRIHAESKTKITDGSWRKKRNVDPALAAQVEAGLRQVMGAPAPAATAAPAPAVDPRQQFVALVGRASAAIQAGKVTQDEINQVCQAAGVPALPLLANRLDLVATVAASFDAIVAGRG